MTGFRRCSGRSRLNCPSGGRRGCSWKNTVDRTLAGVNIVTLVFRRVGFKSIPPPTKLTGIGPRVSGATLDSHHIRAFKKFIPTGKMAVQGEREQGGLEIDMCIDVGSMARDGSFYNPTTNYNQWGRSPSYTEHELCRQTESQNSGAIAPQRNTERAAINSTVNSTMRGVAPNQRLKPRDHGRRGWRTLAGFVHKTEKYLGKLKENGERTNERREQACKRSA